MYFLAFLAGIILCWLFCYVYWIRRINAVQQAEKDTTNNLVAAREKIAKNESKIESLNTNAQSTGEKLKKTEGELKASLASAEALKGQAEGNSKANEDLQKELAEAKSQAESLSECQVELKTSQEKSTALEAEVAELKSRIEALESEPTEVCIDPDDLRKIEGIGPKIADILRANEIRTFAQLAQTEVSQLQAYLDEAGPNFKINDPQSWPAQAKLAADEDWEALQKLQDDLQGGR